MGRVIVNTPGSHLRLRWTYQPTDGSIQPNELKEKANS